MTLSLLTAIGRRTVPVSVQPTAVSCSVQPTAAGGPLRCCRQFLFVLMLLLHFALFHKDWSPEPAANRRFIHRTRQNKVSMVSRLKQENLVELLGYCVEGNLRVLAYEFATMGSLHDILHGRKGVQNAQPGPTLVWITRVRIAVDAARGLEYLHEKVQPAIIHRDIRSSNVLVFEDYIAKIADFNLSNQASDMAARLHSTRVLRTFGYHAPEVRLHHLVHCSQIQIPKAIGLMQLLDQEVA